MNKNKILELLRQNSNRYTKSGEIKEYLFNNGVIASKVVIRKEIKQLRLNGNVIIGKTHGYKLITDFNDPINRKELEKYISDRKAELKSEHIVINKMAQALYNDCDIDLFAQVEQENE